MLRTTLVKQLTRPALRTTIPKISAHVQSFSGNFSALRQVQAASSLGKSSSTFSHLSKSGSVNLRKCSSKPEVEAVFSRPPFPVRAAIVGASVGLATPLFALGGLARLWISYLPSTEKGKIAKRIIGLALGVGSTGLFFNYIIPFLRYNSDFMLPFAMSNAVMATFWYAIGEMWLGIDVMVTGVSEASMLARNVSPAVASFIARIVGASAMAGGAVGALTALTAPYCWPFFFSLCWDRDLKTLLLTDDPYWIIDLYNWIAIPVGLPVGILAGITLQTVLKSFVLGKPGIPWANRSLPLLAGIVGLSGIYYTFFRSFSTDFLWERRLHHTTGEVVSYNPRTGQLQMDNGERADNALMKREVMKRFNKLRYLLRFNYNKKDEPPQPLSPKDDITVSVLDNRASLFAILDVLVRVKYLQLEKKRQAEHRSVINKASLTQSQRDLLKVDFDALIKKIEKEFNIANKGNQAVNMTVLLDLVEKGIISKRIEDRFEMHEDYRGSDHMYADCVRRIQKMSDSCYNEDLRRSLALLAVNLDMAANEFKQKLGFEVVEGSEEEKKMIASYRNSGAYEIVTRTMKIFLVAGALGSGCTALAIFFFGNRS
jgi:hypothetical protein